MSRILITGASGFIGRACLKLLTAQDWEVHAISRRPPAPLASIAWHRADAKNVAEMRVLFAKVRASHLLHLAWCTDPTNFWNSPENDEWLQASIRVLDAFAESGGARIVGVGSCAEYKWNNSACNEHSTPCQPSTLYGYSKLAAGRHLDSLQRFGLSTAWARMFYLYGPGASTSRIPGVVISSLSRGEVARCSAGLQQRDFLYVEDAARAIHAVLNSTISGPINICSGTGTTIAAIAEKTADLMGRSELLQLGAIPSPPHDPPLILGDNSRLRFELGWQQKISLEQGLRATIASWLDQKNTVAA